MKLLTDEEWEEFFEKTENSTSCPQCGIPYTPKRKMKGIYLFAECNCMEEYGERKLEQQLANIEKAPWRIK